MATFWLAKYVEEYYRLKLPCGKQFKSLEEYSPLNLGGGEVTFKCNHGRGCGGYTPYFTDNNTTPTKLFYIVLGCGWVVAI